MGLTIHGSLTYSGRSEANALKTVQKIREIALELPFEDVSEIFVLKGDDANYENHRGKDENSDMLSWMLIQAQESVDCPWHDGRSMRVSPEVCIAFNAYPGWGCEPLNIGLCRFPKTVEWDYNAMDDKKYQRKSGLMNWQKFHNDFPNGHDGLTRKLRTKLDGWRWSSFCKTQYASNPKCGGMPNFVKCHVSVITLLEETAKLPSMKVRINDEGHFGPSNHSDDWREARKEGREPTYVDHEATHDIEILCNECGEYNELIAGFHGGLKDIFGGDVESPITAYPDFEQLEFRGRKDSAELRKIIVILDAIAKKTRTTDEEDVA